MGITPTTKAQISGHKFLTRRLEHGLVLGDIRMIHDPLATRNRAHVFSLAATVLICLGALAMAVFKPAIDPGDAAIIQAESGQLYVRIDNKLHPVANLASARLIVGEAADIHTGSDTVLKNLPKAIPIGIVDAPGLIAPPDTATQKLLSHACHTTTKPVNRLDTAPSQITVIMQETGANPTDTNQTTPTFQRLAVDHAIVGLVDQAEWLVTADGNPGKINSIDDLKNTDGTVAICKEDVPCGTLAHKELKDHNIELKNATNESNVAAVTTKVTSGSADAGFIYTTDLAAAKKDGKNLGSVDLPDVEKNEYPSALTSKGNSSEAAKKFNEWLTTDEAQKILKEHGFESAR